MLGSVYIDTSVLIKWLVSEPFSAQVATFFNEDRRLVINDLVELECDCTLRRIQRSGRITEAYRVQAMQAFGKQIEERWFEKVPFSSTALSDAKPLIAALAPRPLRTLDAIHLVSAKSSHIEQLATADAQMAEAAKALGLNVHFFNDVAI